jgi:streptogramin lyase
MNRDSKRANRGGAWSRKRKPSRLFSIDDSESHRLESRALLALSVTSFSIPLIGVVEPQGITTGPDGNLWFTENAAGAIGSMTTAGALTQFTLPEIPPAAGSPSGTASTPAQPVAITAGPDGALWFTTENSLIGRISTDGTITEYKVSGLTASASSIVAGPDGALWFTGVSGELGRITKSGVVTEFAVPQVPPPAGSPSGTASTPATATGITVGPDGALWFAGVPGEVGRITTSGVVTEFAVPDATGSTQVTPGAITTGPDGALWFTGAPGEIGRMTTAGVVTEFSAPSSFGAGFLPPPSAQAITVGPDGALWFIGDDHQIGQITTAGVFSEFTVPGNFDHIADLALGPNGDLWFSEQEDSSTAGEQPALGEITATGLTTLFPVPQGTTLDPSRGIAVDPGSIATGLDGALWFTEKSAIGRITTDGTIEQFALTTPGATPEDITSGPDGAMWFTEEASDSDDVTTSSIARITTSGAITVYSLPPGSEIGGITSGPGGKLWFTDNYINPSTNAATAKVGWVTAQGQIGTIRLPTKHDRESALGDIVAGPHDELWFLTSWTGNFKGPKTPAAIGSITGRGHIRMYPFLESGSLSNGDYYSPGGPWDLTAGPNGKLWFLGTFSGNTCIARVSTSGKLGTTTKLGVGFPGWGGGNLVKLPNGDVSVETTAGFELVTRSGALITQDLPGVNLNGYAYGGGNPMTLGPDGNLWAVSGKSSIVRISGIDTAPDGNQASAHAKKG